MDALQILWFVLVCVLFSGYFVLEGFDYGVAVLWRVVGKDDGERRMVLHTIGPWWDGNQTWLITAGGAMFASFPGWYAALFSGFYLPLFLILVGLVLRGVAFEFWGKHDSPRWRAAWEWAAIVGSFLPALLWGVAWANVIRGVPMTPRSHDVTASLLDLLHPYALLGGLAALSLFVVHGAQFLTLRLEGMPFERALRVRTVVWPVSLVLVVAFLAWTAIDQGELVSGVVTVVAVVLLLAMRAPGLPAGARFACGAGAIVGFFGAQFAALYPNAIVASSGSTLTLADASSSHYTLTVMTIVACVVLPVVLLYQGWSFWVLRHRLAPEHYGLPKVSLKAFEEPRPRS